MIILKYDNIIVCELVAASEVRRAKSGVASEITLMTVELSLELRQALHQSQGGQPLRLIDPDTNTTYVLVRAELYDQLRSVPNGEDELAASFPAQFDAAMKAGWDDPAMDVYDNYDENRKKRCP